MPRYKAYLSVYATAEFVLESDEPIPTNQLVERFLNDAEATGSLCYQCGSHLESDFEMADYAKLELDEITVEGE